MAGLRISRRAIVPGLAAGAAAALAAAPEPAAAQRGQEYRATCGPCNVWAGHTLRLQFFLPGNGTRQHPFRLVLRTLEGDTIATRDFLLRPGTGKEMDLALREDGTVTLDDDVVFEPEPGQVRLVVIAIIAILIGLLVPAVQKVREAAARASATSFIPGRAPGVQNVDYFLQFTLQGS